MITFLTIYLGLILGPRDYELSVSETTARVEILLDGEQRTELTAPPWTFKLDLGKAPLPHELVAVAYDRQDAEIGRAVQRLNMPHPPVEVVIALTSEGGQVRSARLVWEAAADEALSSLRVRLDGKKIPVADPKNIPLPELDLSRSHHLSAEVTFKGRLRSQAAVVFGGSFVDQVDSELTAVVVETSGDGAGSEVPTATEAAGWFHRQGTPVPVFAVERPPAEVMLVRDQESSDKLRRLASGLTGKRSTSLAGEAARERLLDKRVRELGIGLQDDDWLRIMATQPEQHLSTGKTFFLASGDVLPAARGLGMAVVGLRVAADRRGERLADAVASSGLELSGGGRRRAVLLVIDPKTPDASTLDPQQAKSYLAAMRVPLEIWTAGDSEKVDEVWGSSRKVNKPRLMQEAVDVLAQRLDRQLVVWLEGRWLPSEIELTAEGQRHVALP